MASYLLRGLIYHPSDSTDVFFFLSLSPEAMFHNAEPSFNTIYQ